MTNFLILNLHRLLSLLAFTRRYVNNFIEWTEIAYLSILSKLSQNILNSLIIKNCFLFYGLNRKLFELANNISHNVQIFVLINLLIFFCFINKYLVCSSIEFLSDCTHHMSQNLTLLDFLYFHNLQLTGGIGCEFEIESIVNCFEKLVLVEIVF